MTDLGHHETRMLFRRCRCGTFLTQFRRDCAWHNAGSAQYAADLLGYVHFLRRRERSLWSRLTAAIGTYTQGKIMNVYLFEYIDNEERKREKVRAVDSLDAFNAFRAEHPAVPIADVWVQAFRAK